MHPRWLSAFLDFPAESFGSEVTFWRAIAGSTVSPPRGEHREFASLEPFHGDSHLRVQRIDEGPGGVHLDLHTDAEADLVTHAEALGARVIDRQPDVTVLRSPGGFNFCIVGWGGETTKSRPIRWPDDTISIVDRLSIDVPAQLFDREVHFFAELTGMPAQQAGEADAPELVRLRRDRSKTLGLVLSPTQDDEAAGHLELATNSVSDEVARHQDWGASIVAEHAHWTEMLDPAGLPYRITARNPRTGD